MFHTKSEVDKHVENCLKKITNEKERNNRSYTFAKLYYNVGDYEQTKRYVSSYLSFRPKSSEGHYLLGAALEKLGKKDAALEAYRTSLQIDPKQNNLVVKVCELLANDDVDLDIAGAKYFCELAENMDPYNPSVYNLKEKLIMSEQKNPEGIIKLLLKELESRPTDVYLRVRLLKNFLQNNKIHEAYKHVNDIEEKNLPIFSNSSVWYEAILDVLVRYKRQAQPEHLKWSFWSLFISILDKIMGFKLDERGDTVKESAEYIAHLFFLDQSLYEASQNISDCPDRQLSCEFINHYRGQLCLHFATTILKQAKKDLIPFKEAITITYPLFFAAYHFKPLDMQASWINHLQESLKRFVKRWHQDSSYRCSQAGHILLAEAKDRKSILISKATQHSSGMWQEQIFKKIFVIRDQQLKMSSSYFVTNEIQVNLKLPSKEDLLEFDEESLFVFPDSLQHYVWVSLNSDLPELQYLPFQGLQYSVKNLNNCGAETLNLLDVQAFIFCTTLCAKAKKKYPKQMLHYNMPEAICGQYCSIEQSKFLIAAYKMHRNEPCADTGEIRLTLIRGIETVRCIGRHGLDVSLLVKLADIFTEKASKSIKQSEIEFNDARAELYWKSALPILEKMKNNQAVNYPTTRIFDCKPKMMTLSDICDNIDKGKLYLGQLAMKRKEVEKALSIFEELKDPFASFYQGQIYKQMSEHQLSQNKESVTSEMRSQSIILLSKCRDCFYLTLDRLREPSVDNNHPLNAKLGSEIEKIERMLSRIDSDCSNRNECDGMSDENVSSADSNEHFTSANYTAQFSNTYSSPYVTKNEGRITQSTPLRFNTTRKEARPSPERLDAQIRQLMSNKDAQISHISEQNKFILESNRNIVDELRSLKDAIYSLSSQMENPKMMQSTVNELKEIKKSIDDMKNSVDEFQNFRNVTDLVYELKREIADMKKDNTKPQANDDLYVLDDEYADYNIGNNVAFNPNLYQNYQNRIPPNVPPAAACGLYPHGLYSPFCGTLPFGYPNLGLPQAALPYDQQLPPELRSLTNPLAQANALYGAQPLPQPTPIQPPLNLATSNVNPNLLTGQGLSQLTPQTNILRDAKTSTPLVSVAASMATTTSAVSSMKSAPVNVVITSSDPLPTLQSSIAQPVMSVTIPPQHIKGNIQKSQAHNYQIPLPTSNVSSTPSILSKPAPAISTEGLLTNVAPPVYSAVSDRKTTFKTALEETVSSPVIDLTKSSEIPPDNIAPNESTFFECPAKLFVFANDLKEFKERGNGLLKILENKEKKTIRILMRQDLGNVIANHFITKDIKIASTKDNAYYWSALDYSGANQSIEKFCLQFKNAVDAKLFYGAFETSKQKFEGPLDKSNSANVSASQSGNTFGGFVFTSTPTFKPKDPEQTYIVKPAPAPESKTQSPFANFSFGITNNSTPSLGVSQAASNTTLLSSLSSTPPKVEEQQPLNISKQSDSSLTEEFVPNAEFQPVIPLPDIVEVKTGEENAEVLFDCRAKLLRYDSDKKEWKERGLGNIKILKEKTLIRLLMRREQVHKVCCNHQLLKEMNFQYMPNNLKALTWCAQDYADEVLKPETFAIRFKTEEQANDFLKCILSSQASLSEDSSLKTKEAPKKEPLVQQAPKGFGDKFKPAKGSWECKNCFVVNDTKANQCIACESPRPIKKPEQTRVAKESDVSSTSEPVPKVASSWGDAFKPKAGTWECQCCLIRNESDALYCVSCESPKDETVPKKGASTALKGVNLDTPFKFNFGIGAGTTAATPEPAKQEPSAFKFGSTPNSGFGFGTTAFSFQSPTVAASPKEDPKSFSFGSPSAYEFDFKPRSPRKSIGPGEEESDCSYVEEEADNIYFKPVIPLPDKVDVKTGEEDEEVLYCQRSKLYRYAAGEWKERGVGDLKILRNKGNNKLRVLMRRDQVLKICLNHALTPDIEYLQKDEKTWLFSAADFSEGEVSHDQFCIRFKNSEIAQGFKEALDKAIGSLAKSAEEIQELNKTNTKTLDSSTKVPEKQDSDSDIEFITETTVSDEDLREAERLGLPPKYFAYKQFPLCECDQCAEDDEYFKDTILDENLSKKSSAPSTINDSISSGSPFFKTANSFSFTTTPNPGSTLKEMLIKPSVLATKGSNTSSTENENSSIPVSSSITTSGNLFGSKFSANNLFAPKPATPESALKSFSFISKTPDVSSTSTNLFSSPTVPTATPLFGNTAPITTSVFGSNNSIFKQSPFGSAQPPKSSFFQDNTANIFGNSTEKPATGISSASSSSTNVFGSSTSSIATSATSVFGSTTPTTGGIFDTPKSESTTSPFTSVSAGSLFGTSNTSLFGSGATYEFGKGGSIFNQPKETSSTPIFGNIKTTEIPKTDKSKEDDEVVFRCSSDLTFSSLAKHNTNVAPEFKTAKPDEIIQPFGFLGAGAPVFGAKKNQTPNTTLDKSKLANTTLDKSKQEDESTEEAGAEDDYDPHYEPIIPMPDAIVVSTGEEDETPVFNERAKLFRYDADLKEWKERGIGQMKILHHPTNGTYRFLLRREQVHKVVLNQLITPSLEIQPMTTSDKAWMWAGHNFVEEQTNLEKLAIRFKNQELAQKFFQSVQTCIATLKNAQGSKPSLPTSIQNYGIENVSSDSDPQDENYEQHHENDYDEDYDPYDDEDERCMMFSKMCTLEELSSDDQWVEVGNGEIQIYFDSEVYGSRITFVDTDGEVLSKSVIGYNTIMNLEGNRCTWKTVELASDLPNWRELRGTFDSNESAQSFYDAYLDSVTYAQEWEISDELPGAEIEEIQ